MKLHEILSMYSRDTKICRLGRINEAETVDAICESLGGIDIWAEDWQPLLENEAEFRITPEVGNTVVIEHLEVYSDISLAINIKRCVDIPMDVKLYFRHFERFFENKGIKIKKENVIAYVKQRIYEETDELNPVIVVPYDEFYDDLTIMIRSVVIINTKVRLYSALNETKEVSGSYCIDVPKVIEKLENDRAGN